MLNISSRGCNHFSILILLLLHDDEITITSSATEYVDDNNFPQRSDLFKRVQLTINISTIGPN